MDIIWSLKREGKGRNGANKVNEVMENYSMYLHNRGFIIVRLQDTAIPIACARDVINFPDSWYISRHSPHPESPMIQPQLWGDPGVK